MLNNQHDQNSPDLAQEPIIQSDSNRQDETTSWLPEKKASLISFLFLFFVGFYGIFMVSFSWILYWVFALFFSPKIINSIIKLFGKR